MQLRKIGTISLISLGFVWLSAIATAQWQQPHLPDLSRFNPPIHLFSRSSKAGAESDWIPVQITSEFDYLTQLIPHHQEAIAAARIVMERSDRPELQAFTQYLIDTQSAEVAQMQTWLDKWYATQQTPLTYLPTIRDLNQLTGDELDQAFLEEMILHHHMTVMMSQMLIEQATVDAITTHEAVRLFAEQSSSAQTNEMHHMQTWLYEWFGITWVVPEQDQPKVNQSPRQ